MNFDTDYRDFKEVWTNAHAVMAAGNKNFSEIAIESIFDDLEDYPLELIKQCVKRHRKTAQFAPTPFDIITMINESKGNKHLGVEEAWAIAQQLFDERATVIITNEIMTAYSVSQSLSPDKTAMRMAFKEKYSELVKNATPAKWWATQGTDKDLRISAIKEAVSIGRLSHEAANTICLGYDRPTDGSDVIVKNKLKIIAMMVQSAIESEQKEHDLKKERAEQLKRNALEACKKLRGAL